MTSTVTCELMPPLFNRSPTIEATALSPKPVAPGFARLTRAPFLINRGEGSFLFLLPLLPLRLLRVAYLGVPPPSPTPASPWPLHQPVRTRETRRTSASPRTPVIPPSLISDLPFRVSSCSWRSSCSSPTLLALNLNWDASFR